MSDERPVFQTATGPHRLSAMAQLQMVAAVQPFVSGGVSKTVLLPARASRRSRTSSSPPGGSGSSRSPSTARAPNSPRRSPPTRTDATRRIWDGRSSEPRARAAIRPARRARSDSSTASRERRSSSRACCSASLAERSRASTTAPGDAHRAVGVGPTAARAHEIRPRNSIMSGSLRCLVAARRSDATPRTARCRRARPIPMRPRRPIDPRRTSASREERSGTHRCGA